MYAMVKVGGICIARCSYSQETTCPGFENLNKPLPKNEKGPLLIDVRRSQSSFLSSLFAIKLDCMCLPLSHKALACYTDFGYWSNKQTATSESQPLLPRLHLVFLLKVDVSRYIKSTFLASRTKIRAATFTVWMLGYFFQITADQTYLNDQYISD